MSPAHQQRIFNTALIGAVFVVILDRLAKAWALHIWATAPLYLTSWFSLVFSKNYYISFSLNPRISPLIFIIPIILLLSGFLISMIIKRRLTEAAALSLIFLGAASNAYDRLRYGYVIDYASFRYFSVLNLADALITIGSFWGILLYKKTLDKLKI